MTKPAEPPLHRHVVITGVTRGCGRALALECMRRGHVVSGCGRSPENIRGLQRSHGAPHAFEVLDVREAAAVAAWARRVQERAGAPDLLVNNAAVINRNAPLWEVPAAEFNAVVDINVKGMANVIRCFLPGMLRRQRGVLVNFSSGWGRSVDAEVAPYCATKWAVEGLTRALALELPAGLAAVPLNPGIIDTEMLRSCFGAAAGHYPDPESWARTAAPFLLNLGPSDNGMPLTVPEG